MAERGPAARPALAADAPDPVGERLAVALGRLDEAQLRLLVQMAEAMATRIESRTEPGSDIATKRFSVSFSNQLLLHHATHEEKLNKKSFEYVFKAACETDEKAAEINPDPTNAAEDVRVDGVKFSLKTEAAAGMRPGAMNIQKLMEARWIRDYSTRADLAREAASRIGRHLSAYERILVLRAFDHGETAIKYELVEIPKKVLMRIAKLTAADFEEKNEKGGCGANVMDERGQVFRVYLDGSVEKVRIFSLRKDRCTAHGEWIIPRPKPTGSTGE